MPFSNNYLEYLANSLIILQEYNIKLQKCTENKCKETFNSTIISNLVETINHYNMKHYNYINVN